jgi:hypothetical protein
MAAQEHRPGSEEIKELVPFAVQGGYEVERWMAVGKSLDFLVGRKTLLQVETGLLAWHRR